METDHEHLLEEINALQERINRLHAQNQAIETNSEQGEERYKRLVRFLTDYIYTVSMQDGQVVDTYHGPGCLAVTGYSSKDFAAEHLFRPL